MTSKHIISFILGTLTLTAVALSVYLVQYRRAVVTPAPREPDLVASPNKTWEDRVMPEKAVEAPVNTTSEPRSTPQPQRILEQPTVQPKGAPSEGGTIPPPHAQPKSTLTRVVPKHPSAVFRSQKKKTMVKLCGGDSITQCTKVRFTHTGFALLLLDILGLDIPENRNDAFDILESLQIGPVNGWARDNPSERITLQEMEELRCTISLAFENGFTAVGPSTVAARVNRFCEAWEVSQRIPEDSEVITDGHGRLVETGYEGGGDSVTSPPY